MNLFYLAELHLQKTKVDYTMLNILDTAIYIRKRMDRLQYFKDRYRKTKEVKNV